MLDKIISIFDNHSFQEYSSNKDKVTKKKLEKVESFQGDLIESDILITLLCCVEGKKGGDVTCNFSEQERFNEFVDLLNSMGLNCLVDFEPELTEAENMRALLDEEGKKELDEMIEDSEVRARIFMTKNEHYSISYFRKMLFLQGKTIKYHRMYGEFLGFPKENIDCFVFRERNKYIRKLLELIGKDKPELVSDWDLADRNKQRLTEREFGDLRAFLYSLYPDTKDTLDKALETASERRKKLQKYEIDVEHYTEIFLDW